MHNLIKPLRFPLAVTLVGAAVCTLAQALSAESNLTYAPATKVQVADAFWKPLLDRNRGWSNLSDNLELYCAGEPIRATAIPYHLWSNRGAGEMTVWLNTVPAQSLHHP